MSSNKKYIITLNLPVADETKTIGNLPCHLVHTFTSNPCESFGDIMKALEPWVPFAEFLGKTQVNYSNRDFVLSILKKEKRILTKNELSLCFFVFMSHMSVEPNHPIDIIHLLCSYPNIINSLPFESIDITGPLVIPESLVRVINDKMALDVAENTYFIHPFEKYMEVSAMEDVIVNDAGIQFLSTNHFCELGCPNTDEGEKNLISESRSYHLECITNSDGNPRTEYNPSLFTDHRPMGIRMKDQGIAYIFSYRCAHNHIGEFFLVLDLDKVDSTNGNPEKKGKIVGYGTADQCKLFHVDDIVEHFSMICYEEELSLPDGTRIDTLGVNRLRALLSVKNWKMEIDFEDGSNILDTNILDFNV
jgi:hypothetical protein